MGRLGEVVVEELDVLGRQRRAGAGHQPELAQLEVACDAEAVFGAILVELAEEARASTVAGAVEVVDETNDVGRVGVHGRSVVQHGSRTHREGNEVVHPHDPARRRDLEKLVAGTQIHHEQCLLLHVANQCLSMNYTLWFARRATREEDLNGMLSGELLEPVCGRVGELQAGLRNEGVHLDALDFGRGPHGACVGQTTIADDDDLERERRVELVVLLEPFSDACDAVEDVDLLAVVQHGIVGEEQLGANLCESAVDRLRTCIGCDERVDRTDAVGRQCGDDGRRGVGRDVCKAIALLDSDPAERLCEQRHPPPELSPGHVDRLSVGARVGQTASLGHLDERSGVGVRPVVRRLGRAERRVGRVEREEQVLRHGEARTGEPLGQIARQRIRIREHLVEAHRGADARIVPHGRPEVAHAVDGEVVQLVVRGEVEVVTCVDQSAELVDRRALDVVGRRLPHERLRGRRRDGSCHGVDVVRRAKRSPAPRIVRRAIQCPGTRNRERKR
ncbi:hypothetical protein L1887_56491 [Cichorium endivia]|nr:hypothetical protein L1887_56491 [Cichorium endivia]